MALRTGKLPPELLRKMLKHSGAMDKRVVLGPSIGEDAAVVRLGKQLLVLKTDPVTYASDMIGWYAVNVNANDVVTRGARPAWFQAVILLHFLHRLPGFIDNRFPFVCRELSGNSLYRCMFNLGILG